LKDGDRKRWDIPIGISAKLFYHIIPGADHNKITDLRKIRTHYVAPFIRSSKEMVEAGAGEVKTNMSSVKGK
jgi:hypothetical protein